MSDTFEYKPRFKDMRIKPPKGQARAAEKVCEYPKCVHKADSRAPKGPDRLNEYYWFCQRHAGEYNKSWNFFEGMSEGAATAFRQGMSHGHRPTWGFATGGASRRKAQRASVDWQKAFFDPFSVFGERPASQQQQAKPSQTGPRPGRLQEKALETLGLQMDADKKTVRKRYAELLRAYHPDANGGDRSTEELLQKVVASYQILRNSGQA